MKKIVLFFFLFSLVNIVIAQTEKTGNKTAATGFQRLYNNEQFDSVFQLFSPQMQTALPLDKTTDFLNGLKTSAGKITAREFIRYENGSYATYKTTFERGLFTLAISVDGNNNINGLFVRPFVASNLPKMERNTTPMQLPFTDEWTVVWGGDTKEQNYHIESVAQKNAFDFVITNAQGKTYKTDGKTNEDYYAFGKELLAPADGEVVLVVEGIKDNQPGTLNPIYIPGNTVFIKTAANEYLFFAHFKQHSITVKQGQMVKAGDLLGLCGNSGNSSEAHLHFHIQNVEDMNIATGVKCFFKTLLVNGQLKGDYSPVKGDKIKRQ